MNSIRDHSHRSTESNPSITNIQRSSKLLQGFSSDVRSPSKKSSQATGEPQTVEENQTQFNNPELGFVFSPLRDGVKPYHLDGDSSMYTETAIARRMALKSDSIVNESINDFLNMFQFDSNGYVTKKEFERVYHKLCGVLRPDLDPVEKKKLLEED